MREAFAVLTKGGKEKTPELKARFQVSCVFASCWGSVPLRLQSHLVSRHLGAARCGQEASSAQPGLLVPPPLPQTCLVPFHLVLLGLLAP